MVVGLGYRREMVDWDMSAIDADFFEVAPENWIRRDRTPLYRLLESGRSVHLHGVSLSLGGPAPLNRDFLGEVRGLINDLGATQYSDHLAASGDAHQLYDLFPIPFTLTEVRRVADRIREAQDLLGMQIAVENVTWYTNIGDIPEAEFVARIVDLADCRLLLDLNNIAVNHKNHRSGTPTDFLQHVDLDRVSYLHVAGREFDERFGLYLDTHSQPVEPDIRQLASWLSAEQGLPILLEWDNDLPEPATLNRELSCLKTSLTTSAV